MGLIQMDRCRQIPEPVFTQIHKGDLGRLAVELVVGDLGEDDLSTVGGVPHPAGAVHGGPEIVVTS
jgi:hypothetical protein